jgi:NADH-quinone oxidoreductase subunit J
MGDFLFYLFASMTLACAAGVVLNRNAVNSAMCLLLCLVGIAGLFVRLDAYLLAFLLLLVYAGAIVALFLFIVMLLDLGGPPPPARSVASRLAGLAAVVLVLAGLGTLVLKGRLAVPAPPADPGVGAALKPYAYQLFTTYLLPVQVMGFLLLVAMIGVIVLSRHPGPGEGKP